MKYSPLPLQDGCLYHCSDIREKAFFFFFLLLFMHHKALLSPSSVEKEVSWLSNKRAKKIQDGWNFRAGETEEREDSLGFARSTRIPVLGLYLNSRVHIRYVSASSFLIFFFFFYLPCLRALVSHIFPHCPFQPGTQFKLHICLSVTYLLWNCSLQRPWPQTFFAPPFEIIEHSSCRG